VRGGGVGEWDDGERTKIRMRRKRRRRMRIDE
jgi:hypothetical protein